MVSSGSVSSHQTTIGLKGYYIQTTHSYSLIMVYLFLLVIVKFLLYVLSVALGTYKFRILKYFDSNLLSFVIFISDSLFLLFFYQLSFGICRVHLISFSFHLFIETTAVVLR